MVGVAVIGGGLFAREDHVPALVANNANILAVYSRSTQSADLTVAAVKEAGSPETASRIQVYSDEKDGDGLGKLLQRSDVHAVVIILPILLQPDIVRRCFAAGKHVLCEKPVGKDVHTGRELVEEYERVYSPRGLIFSIAEQFRYDRGFTRAREIVASGEIGNLVNVDARLWMNMVPGNKYYETAWRKEPEYQGGFILDGGVHFIALIRKVAGQQIQRTQALAIQHHPHLAPMDTVNANLQFSGGAIGTFSLSFASSKPSCEFIFVGSKGSLTITNKPSGDAGWRLIIEDAETHTQREETLDSEAMYEEINAFLHAVASGVPDKQGNPREALADVAVIESICSGGGKVQYPSPGLSRL